MPPPDRTSCATPRNSTPSSSRSYRPRPSTAKAANRTSVAVKTLQHGGITSLVDCQAHRDPRAGTRCTDRQLPRHCTTGSEIEPGGPTSVNRPAAHWITRTLAIRTSGLASTADRPTSRRTFSGCRPGINACDSCRRPKGCHLARDFKHRSIRWCRQEDVIVVQCF